MCLGGLLTWPLFLSLHLVPSVERGAPKFLILPSHLAQGVQRPPPKFRMGSSLRLQQLRPSSHLSSSSRRLRLVALDDIFRVGKNGLFRIHKTLSGSPWCSERRGCTSLRRALPPRSRSSSSRLLRASPGRLLCPRQTLLRLVDLCDLLG